MRTIMAFLIMTGIALASPCDDERKQFERAKKFGASGFVCKDHYDGSASSRWVMDTDNYKRYVASELERSSNRIKRKGKR